MISTKVYFIYGRFKGGFFYCNILLLFVFCRYCPECRNDSSEVVLAGEKLKESKKKAKMASASSSSQRDWGKVGVHGLPYSVVLNLSRKGRYGCRFSYQPRSCHNRLLKTDYTCGIRLCLLLDWNVNLHSQRPFRESFDTPTLNASCFAY